MEVKGRVTKVKEINSDTLRVSGDCSEMRDDAVWARRAFSFDIPAKFASAYTVGREVKIQFSPVEK